MKSDDGLLNPDENIGSEMKRKKVHMVQKRNFIRIIGVDLGLNHCGLVQFDDGEMTNFWYITDYAGSAEKSKEHGIRLKIPSAKSKDRQLKSVERLAVMSGHINKILNQTTPDYVGMEDYAIREEQGAHYLGEIGGIIRLVLYLHPIRFRLHDPVTVKMYGAHDGTCSKEYARHTYIQRWNLPFEQYDQPLAKPTKRVPNPKQNTQTSGDLSDAYAIAQMVWDEVRIRAGTIMLSDLEHNKERQVFLRVTKTYPVNLLDREWIYRPGEV